MGDFTGVIYVRPGQTEPFLAVRIELPGYQYLMKVVERVRRIFDLGADPLRIADDLSRDPRLKPLIEHRPGLRVPGVWDGFELAVQAILGEQLTDAGSTAQIGQIVRTFGKPVQSSVPGLTHAFPNACGLGGCRPFQSGHSRRSRSKTLALLARAVWNEELIFSASVDLEEAISLLECIPGIRKARPTTSPCGHWANRTPFPMPRAGASRGIADLRRISEAVASLARVCGAALCIQRRAAS